MYFFDPMMILKATKTQLCLKYFKIIKKTQLKAGPFFRKSSELFPKGA
ncbi:hypothetical protein J647_1291 [Acinetobacter baumannii 846928]|nr:hypothetical protein J647_1291 [Acinetobacter baumannii 846928]